MSEPNECPRLIEVHQLWEGDIDAARAGEVRQHLAHCSCCRSEFEQLGRLSALLSRGDLAPPLIPERQRLMKGKLLEACAESLDGECEAVRRRSAVGIVTWAWRMPFRIALGLVPVTAALLLLLHLGRGAPPVETGPTGGVSSQGARLSPSEHRAHSSPRQPADAVRTPATRDDRIRARRLVPTSHFVMGPRRTAGRRRLVRAVSPPSPPREQQPERPTYRANAPTTAGQRLARVPEADDAPPRPIERIVIQVDEPPPGVAQSVIHVTVIASGDLEAPDAKLTVVRSQRGEALP